MFRHAPLNKNVFGVLPYFYSNSEGQNYVELKTIVFVSEKGNTEKNTKMLEYLIFAVCALVFLVVTILVLMPVSGILVLIFMSPMSFRKITLELSDNTSK